MSNFFDGLVNVLTGLGTSRSKAANNVWHEANLSDRQQLEAAYLSNWIAARIVDVPAKEMTREWRSIKCSAAEAIEAVEQELCLQQLVDESIRWSDLYGGAGIIMLTNQDLGKPLDINKIGEGDLKRMLVFDRYDLQADVINQVDPLALNYMRPEFYTLINGSQRIHWSHVAQFHGAPLPRRRMAATQGWGDSRLRKVIDDVTAFMASIGGISELMQQANVDVIRVEGLQEALASGEDKSIMDRYTAFNMAKSCINLALMDSTEEYSRNTLNLTGAAPVIEQLITMISGSAETPVVKLFGTSAKGMNATGEGDLSIHYDNIRARQVSLRQPMRVIDEVLVRSAVGSWPDDYDFQWNSLYQSDNLELAQAEALRAQKDLNYLNAGVITRSQVQRKLQSTEQYQFDDDAISQLEELEDPNAFDEPVDHEAEENAEDSE